MIILHADHLNSSSLTPNFSHIWLLKTATSKTWFIRPGPSLPQDWSRLWSQRVMNIRSPTNRRISLYLTMGSLKFKAIWPCELERSEAVCCVNTWSWLDLFASSVWPNCWSSQNTGPWLTKGPWKKSLRYSTSTPWWRTSKLQNTWRGRVLRPTNLLLLLQTCVN